MPDGVTIIDKLDEPSMGESSFKGRPSLRGQSGYFGVPDHAVPSECSSQNLLGSRLPFGSLRVACVLLRIGLDPQILGCVLLFMSGDGALPNLVHPSLLALVACDRKPRCYVGKFGQCTEVTL
jgi:hypothetical protein